MYGISEIKAMNKTPRQPHSGAANPHTLLPGIVRDTLRAISKAERHALIGQVLQVLANESGPTSLPSRNLKLEADD